MKRIFAILIFAVFFALSVPYAASAEETHLPELADTAYSLAVGMKEPVVIQNRTDSAKITWTSGNTKVASVSKDGVITAKKAGDTLITAVYSDADQKLTFTVPVTVEKTLGVRQEYEYGSSHLTAIKSVTVGGTSFFATNYQGSLPLECNVDDGTLAAVTTTPDGLIEIRGLKEGSTYLNIRYGEFVTFKKLTVQKSLQSFAEGITTDVSSGKSSPFITLKNTNSIALADILVRYRAGSELRFDKVSRLEAGESRILASHLYGGEKISSVSIESCKIASDMIPILRTEAGKLSVATPTNARQFVCLFRREDSIVGAPLYDMFSIDARMYSCGITMKNQNEADVMLDKLLICIMGENGDVVCDFEVPLEGYGIEAGGDLTLTLTAAGGKLGTSFGTSETYSASNPMKLFDTGFVARIGSRALPIENFCAKKNYSFTDRDTITASLTGSF